MSIYQDQGSGIPSGGTKQVQVNKNGTFGSESNFEYDDVLNKLTIKEDLNSTTGATGKFALQHTNGTGTSEYEFYQNADDILILKRTGDTTGDGAVYSILQLEAPTNGPSEATFTGFARNGSAVNFVDWYQCTYGADKNSGIRLQTRGTGVDMPFKIERHNGVKQILVGCYITASQFTLIYDPQTLGYTPQVGDWLFENTGTKISLNSYITAINTTTRTITLNKPILITDTAGTLSVRVTPVKIAMEIATNNNISIGTPKNTSKLNVGGDVDISGNYLINGQIIPTAKIGDAKAGFQLSDHSGWIKLDGRLKSTLTTIQQIEATNLGFGANIANTFIPNSVGVNQFVYLGA